MKKRLVLVLAMLAGTSHAAVTVTPVRIHVGGTGPSGFRFEVLRVHNGRTESYNADAILDAAFDQLDADQMSAPMNEGAAGFSDTDEILIAVRRSGQEMVRYLVVHDSGTAGSFVIRNTNFNFSSGDDSIALTDQYKKVCFNEGVDDVPCILVKRKVGTGILAYLKFEAP